MKKQQTTLKDLRDQLDKVDLQIQQLINQRAKLALEVGRLKKTIDKKPVFYRPEREAQILRKIAERNSGPLDQQIVLQIFRTLLTACLAMQQKIKIAFLGPIGTFSQAAVFKHFGNEIETVTTETIEEVFQQVAAHRSDYGVVPIENTITGVIQPTLNALINSMPQICGEIILPIHQNLLRPAAAKIAIKHVYGHEQSLMQCKNWLATHLPTAEKIAVSSNGAAAKLVQNSHDSAAIAGDLAAEIYSLKKIAVHIEDNAQNQTRFLIIGSQSTPPSGSDKTTLLITTPHTPGALIKLIQPFADCKVNITWIESRPYQHRTWSYLFFLDIEGHQEDKNVNKALTQLATQPVMVSILGSYPKALS